MSWKCFECGAEVTSQGCDGDEAENTYMPDE